MESLKAHVMGTGDYMTVDTLTKEPTGEIDMKACIDDGKEWVQAAFESIREEEVKAAATLGLPPHDGSLGELNAMLEKKEREHASIQKKRERAT